MAVPKRRVSHSRKKLRQTHQKLDAPPIVMDAGSRSVHRRHHIDLRTGLYRGRQVLFRDEDAADSSKA